MQIICKFKLREGMRITMGMLRFEDNYRKNKQKYSVLLTTE